MWAARLLMLPSPQLSGRAGSLPVLVGRLATVPASHVATHAASLPVSTARLGTVPAPRRSAHAEPPVLAAPLSTVPARHPSPPLDSLVRGLVVVHYGAGDERLARQILEVASASLALPALPGDVLRTGGPIRIFLAPDPAAFDSLTGGRIPEWGAGVAFPATGRIVLPAYASSRGAPHDLGRVLRHELAHVALHRYLRPARIPRWFDEGYARWAAGEWTWQAAWELRLAFALHRTPPLDSLALDWPAGAVDARVAYLLATRAVAFLVERSGVRGLRLFLARWAEGDAMEPALRRTYGLTLAQFEEDWREDVEESYGWAFLLSYSLVFWLFVALALFLLYAIRRRRDRERRAALRAAEPPDDPAYWLE